MMYQNNIPPLAAEELYLFTGSEIIGLFVFLMVMMILWAEFQQRQDENKRGW